MAGSLLWARCSSFLILACLVAARRLDQAPLATLAQAESGAETVPAALAAEPATATATAGSAGVVTAPAAGAAALPTPAAAEAANAAAAAAPQQLDPAAGVGPGGLPTVAPPQFLAPDAPADPTPPLATAPGATGGVRVRRAAATPAPLVTVTVKLDSSGNVGDVIFARADGTTVGGCNTAPGALPGGRNVVLDFTDSPIVQIQLGKFSTSATAPVAWLGFRTDSADLRAAGNVRPSAAAAVITWFTAAPPTSSGSRSSLSALSTTCNTAKQLTQLSGVTFAAPVAAYVPLQPNVKACCTPVFSWPYSNVTSSDSNCCKLWVFFNSAQTQPAPNPTCPWPSAAAGNPHEWTQPITAQQLPVSRPPDWPYRAVSTALSKSVNLTTRSAGNYITATVTHKPVPGVTAEMAYWWFNGNVDGDMVLNNATWPRYLVWHPRDHVSQNTIIPGARGSGSAVGAYWSLVEFFLAPTGGFVKSSPAGSWANSYTTFVNPYVYALSLSGIELRIKVDSDFPLRLVHSWSTTTVGGSPALALTSTMYVGLQPPTDNTWVSGSMNPVAFKIFGGDCAFGAATAWVQHCVEEMGNLQYFLPQLYHSQTGL